MSLSDFPAWTVWQAKDGRWYATRDAQRFPRTLDALSEAQLRIKLAAQERKEGRR